MGARSSRSKRCSIPRAMLAVRPGHIVGARRRLLADGGVDRRAPVHPALLGRRGARADDPPGRRLRGGPARARARLLGDPPAVGSAKSRHAARALWRGREARRRNSRVSCGFRAGSCARPAARAEQVGFSLPLSSDNLLGLKRSGPSRWSGDRRLGLVPRSRNDDVNLWRRSGGSGLARKSASSSRCTTKRPPSRSCCDACARRELPDGFEMESRGGRRWLDRSTRWRRCDEFIGGALRVGRSPDQDPRELDQSRQGRRRCAPASRSRAATSCRAGRRSRILAQRLRRSCSSPSRDPDVQVVYGSRFMRGMPKGMKLRNLVANLVLSGRHDDALRPAGHRRGDRLQGLPPRRARSFRAAAGASSSARSSPPTC